MVELYDPNFQKSSCDGKPDRLDCTDLLAGVNIYFDGEFYVAKLPPGFKMYVGTIAQYKALYHTFSREKLENLSDDDYHNPGPVWFSSVRVARMYSKEKECDKCLYSFSTKEETSVIVLSNVYNLVKLAMIMKDPSNLYIMYSHLEAFVTFIKSKVGSDSGSLDWLTPEFVQNAYQTDRVSMPLSKSEIIFHENYLRETFDTKCEMISIPSFMGRRKITTPLQIMYDEFKRIGDGFKQNAVDSDDAADDTDDEDADDTYDEDADDTDEAADASDDTDDEDERPKLRSGDLWLWKPHKDSPHKQDIESSQMLSVEKVVEYVMKRATEGTLTLPNNDHEWNRVVLHVEWNEILYKPRDNIYRFTSDTNTDIGFSRQLQQYFRERNLKYCGYMTPRVKILGLLPFHEEIMLFNPYHILRRDFSDPVDAYNDRIPQTQGPVLQQVAKRLKHVTRPELGGSLWAHTVWSLLYTEKILEFYQRSIYLNINTIDSRFIAFASLVHELPDDTYIQRLAEELSVPLDYHRLQAIKIVRDRYHEFSKIVDTVAQDTEKYLTPQHICTARLDVPHCDDLKKHSSQCKKDCQWYKFSASQELLALLKQYTNGLTPLQIATLVTVSMAHVIGMIAYNSRTSYIPMLTHLTSTSKNFPIANQYQTEPGSEKKSAQMRKIGIVVGHTVFTNMSLFH